MRRVAAWLVSLAVALLGWLPVSAPDAVAVTKPLTIHTYDSPMYGTPSDYTEFARGPPTNDDYTAHVKAVDHASHGASARMSATTTAPSYHYDGSVPLAPVDNTTGTTATSGAAIGAEFSALHRSEVAAKTGDTLLSAGGGSARLPMNMGSVRSVASKYGIPIDDLSISINRSLAGIRGSTASNGCVTLCRGAFESEEQLAKTLVHERVHVEDLRGGMPYPSTYDAASAAEIRAEAIANAWWESFR